MRRCWQDLVMNAYPNHSVSLVDSWRQGKLRRSVQIVFDCISNKSITESGIHITLKNCFFEKAKYLYIHRINSGGGSRFIFNNLVLRLLKNAHIVSSIITIS